MINFTEYRHSMPDEVNEAIKSACSDLLLNGKEFHQLWRNNPKNKDLRQSIVTRKGSIVSLYVHASLHRHIRFIVFDTLECSKQNYQEKDRQEINLYIQDLVKTGANRKRTLMHLADPENSPLLRYKKA